MKNSLFFVGEIGGNDYNHLFIRRKTIDEVRAIVPDVADAIGAAVKVIPKTSMNYSKYKLLTVWLCLTFIFPEYPSVIGAKKNMRFGLS
jgi:hypothetical protein